MRGSNKGKMRTSAGMEQGEERDLLELPGLSGVEGMRAIVCWQSKEGMLKMCEDRTEREGKQARGIRNKI